MLDIVFGEVLITFLLGILRPAFLVLLIYVCVKADKGEYKETACNIAMVSGILAGIIGCTYSIAKNDGIFVFLNIIVMAMAFAVKFVAKLLAKLYLDKQAALFEEYERDRYLHSSFDDENKKPVYTEDNFDDEELRFGKGGYTDPKF